MIDTIIVFLWVYFQIWVFYLSAITYISIKNLSYQFDSFLFDFFKFFICFTTNIFFWI